MRYLGNVADLAGAADVPRVEDVRLPHLTYEKSSELTWALAVGLAEPFLAAMVGLGLGLEASAKMNRHRKTHVRISLGRTARRFCSAVAIGSWFDHQHLRLPVSLGGVGPLYIVESALYAKELSVTVTGDSATDFSLDLAASVAGKLNPELVLRSNSTVQITGVHPAAFGITCLEVRRDAEGRLIGLQLLKREPHAAATGVAMEQRFGLARQPHLLFRIRDVLRA